MKNMTNKRLSGCTLLLACVISIDLGEGLSNASQQMTGITPTAQVQIQGRQNPNNNDRIDPDLGGVREINGTQRSSSSTDETEPFGGDTCRPEKIEATPCQ